MNLSFLSELKRRNVYRVAITDVVIAWLLIQVGSILFSAFEPPGWTIKVFVAVIAAGFVLALFIASAIEITSEEIKRMEDISPNKFIPQEPSAPLAKIADLKVVSRASTERYQSDPGGT